MPDLALVLLLALGVSFDFTDVLGSFASEQCRCCCVAVMPDLALVRLLALGVRKALKLVDKLKTKRESDANLINCSSPKKSCHEKENIFPMEPSAQYRAYAHLFCDLVD